MGLAFGAAPSTILWKLSMVFQLVVFVIILSKYFTFHHELGFLREFHYLSQTMDDIRRLESGKPFDHLLKAVVHLMRFDRSIFFLKESETNFIRPVSWQNIEQNLITDLEAKGNDFSLGFWASLNKNEPEIILPSSKAFHALSELFCQNPKQEFLTAPIIGEKNFLGFILALRDISRERFSDDDLVQMQVLADQLGITLKNHFLHKEVAQKAEQLERQNLQIHKELELAKMIQDSVFPRSPPNWKGISFAAYRRSARFVGGDFYNYLGGCRWGDSLCENATCGNCPRQVQGILIGDVCGKGIPAAIGMAMVNSLLNEKVVYFMSDPARILTEVNLSLKRYLGAESRFNSSAFVGFYEPKEQKFVYSNAGHDFPLYYNSKDKSLSSLESTGTLLGLFRESKFSAKEIKLQSGDRLFFYTDGLVDFFEKHQNSEDGFGPLKSFMLNRISYNVHDFIKEISNLVGLVPGEGDDDITAVMMAME
ncbi:SpoIIE family protein phosphatase [bacterium]|nr:SpoIIE family protein phosphatase [bacterium]